MVQRCRTLEISTLASRDSRRTAGDASAFPRETLSDAAVKSGERERAQAQGNDTLFKLDARAFH